MLQHFDTWWRKAAFVAFLAAFAIVTGVAVASLSARIGRPSPGFLVWDNLVVPAIGARDWPGARAGIPYRSVVTEIDAHPLRNAAELDAHLRSIAPGTPVVYTFRRGAEIQRIKVPATVFFWRDLAPVFLPYLIVGVAFFATGLIVFYFRPRLPAAHAGLAIGVFLGGTLVLAIDTLSSFWLERLYFFIEAMVPGALLHFALCFPEEKRIAVRYPSLKYLVYVPFAALGLLQNLSLASAPEAHLAINDWVYTSIAGAGLVMIGSLLHTFATSTDPVARQQSKVVAAGVAFAAFVPSLGLLAIVVGGFEIPMNFLSPFYVVYPLSVAWAIGRHNLFDVDRYLRLGVVYAALTLVFLAGYAGLVVGLERWSGAERRLPAGAVPLYLLTVVLLLDPLRSRLQSVVDRLFYRRVYSYRATVEATSRALASILDSDRIAAVVLETLTDVMAIEWGALAVVDESGEVSRVYARPAPRGAVLESGMAAQPATTAIALQRQRLWTRYDQPWRPSDVDDSERLATFGAAVLVPARFEEKAIGLLALGERRSGALYSGEDLDLVQTLANQAALALENAHAYEVIQRTQQELVRAERLAAVGELSAAVAHGIRNPLAGIRAAAQVAHEEPEDVATVREGLEDIIAEADRLESRVRTLLDFARPFEPTLAAVDLNALVRGFAEDIRKRVPPHIQFSTSLDASLPAAAADRVQVTEILEALVVNALEAMNGGGSLQIRTAHHAGSERPAVICVQDTGAGIEPEQRKKIFELFYTTKSSGTGIGLATVKKLVERQGGSIEVESAVGAGTTFEVRWRVAG